MTERNLILFLLGSGISKNAGLPLTAKISKDVISGKGISRSTESTFYFNPTNTPIDEDIKHIEYIQFFLKELQTIISDFYEHYGNPVPDINYEMLAYLCTQLQDNELFEYENPGIFPLYLQIQDTVKKILNEDEYFFSDKASAKELFAETVNFIKDIVWRSLLVDHSSLDYLSSISDCCKDNLVNRVDFFTLNHDTLLEKHLREKSIPFSDGFSEDIYGVRYWEPDNFTRGTSKVRLIKLHGSIDWFRFPPNKFSCENSSIGQVSEWDYQHTKNPDGFLQYPEDFHPIFLTGTFNKILQYTNEIFRDLFFQFHTSLKQSNTLIISGYGFGDKGINFQIIEWMNSSIENRMLVIHHKPESLFDLARPAIGKNVNEWTNQGRLILIRNKIEKTSWDEIKNLID